MHRPLASRASLTDDENQVGLAIDPPRPAQF